MVCSKPIIQKIVDDVVREFANDFEQKHISQRYDLDGVINSKRNNVFMSTLDNKFVVYSALSRSFDSSMGSMFERLANEIAKYSYQVFGDICAIFTNEQNTFINNLISCYDKHQRKPEITDYSCRRFGVDPLNDEMERHKTDIFLFDGDTYYLIELKAGGDLDNKKAKSEKRELLKQYFMLTNTIDSQLVPYGAIRIFLATAYNKEGEGNEWASGGVTQYFAQNELLIGGCFWNFICRRDDGFQIIVEQFMKSSEYINNAIANILSAYGI